MLERIYKAQLLMHSACRKMGRQINIMEVCGTHTVSIFRSGIRSTLPVELKLLSGPGCPVCVTDQGYIDTVLRLADRRDCLIATYGDMIRVPGKGRSLETKQPGANIKVILSSEDAGRVVCASPRLLVRSGDDCSKESRFWQGRIGLTATLGSRFQFRRPLVP